MSGSPQGPIFFFTHMHSPQLSLLVHDNEFRKHSFWQFFLGSNRIGILDFASPMVAPWYTKAGISAMSVIVQQCPSLFFLVRVRKNGVNLVSDSIGEP